MTVEEKHKQITTLCGLRNFQACLKRLKVHKYIDENQYKKLFNMSDTYNNYILKVTILWDIISKKSK